jgi:hypothetical protein
VAVKNKSGNSGSTPEENVPKSSDVLAHTRTVESEDVI